jgi:hypothetical protein
MRGSQTAARSRAPREKKASNAGHLGIESERAQLLFFLEARVRTRMRRS